MPSRKYDAANALVLAGAANANKHIHVAASNTIVLTSSVFVSKHLPKIEHALTLTQEVTHNQKWASAQNTISLTQAIEKTNAKIASTSNILLLFHSVSSSIANGVASSQLNLTQTVQVSRPLEKAISNSLLDPEFTYEEISTLTQAELAALAATRGLRHSVDVKHSIIARSVTSFLQIAQQAAKYVPISVSHHIHLTHSVSTEGKYAEASSILTLSQSVVVVDINPASSVITLTQTVNPDFVFVRSASNTLTLTQSAHPSTFDRNEVSVGYTPPTLVVKNYILLTHPYSGPTTSLQMRPPEFDNVEQLEFRRINRRTRGGTLEISRPGYWPKAERLILKFTSLTEDKANELLNFFYTSLGEEIGLLDHENRQWRGIIITPAEKVIDRDGRGCNFAADFEFEGVTV